MNSDEFLAQKAAFQAQIKERGTEILSTIFKAVIDDGTIINGVTWNQYTPVWNDGDPCHFGLGEVDFYLNVPGPTEVKCTGCSTKWLISDRPKFCSNCGRETREPEAEVKISKYEAEGYAKEHQLPELLQAIPRMESFLRLFNQASSVLELVFGDPVEVHVYYNDDGSELEFEVHEYEVQY